MRHCGLLLDISDTQIHVHTTHYLPTILMYHVMFAHVQDEVYNYLTPTTGKASSSLYQVGVFFLIEKMYYYFSYSLNDLVTISWIRIRILICFN